MRIVWIALIALALALAVCIGCLWAVSFGQPAPLRDATGTPIPGSISERVTVEIGGIAAASILAFFAFVGFEDIVNIAEEARDPRHILPRAIAITLVVTTVVYIAVVAAVLIAVPLGDLAGSTAPLALVFANAPPWVQSGFASVAVVATINGVLIQIILASRVLYGMANRGQLPKLLARISPTSRTPDVATALVVLAILGFSQFVPIERLAGYTSQIVLAIFVFVNLSLIAIKRRKEPSGDAFVVPFVVPILGLVASTGMLFLSLV